MSADENGDEGFEETNESYVETTPNEAADPQSIVESKIPAGLRSKYEFLSYRNAAVILTETRPAEFNELLEALKSSAFRRT